MIDKKNNNGLQGCCIRCMMDDVYIRVKKTLSGM